MGQEPYSQNHQNKSSPSLEVPPTLIVGLDPACVSIAGKSFSTSSCGVSELILPSPHLCKRCSACSLLACLNPSTWQQSCSRTVNLSQVCQTVSRGFPRTLEFVSRRRIQVLNYNICQLPLLASFSHIHPGSGSSSIRMVST